MYHSIELWWKKTKFKTFHVEPSAWFSRRLALKCFSYAFYSPVKHYGGLWWCFHGAVCNFVFVWSVNLQVHTLHLGNMTETSLNCWVTLHRMHMNIRATDKARKSVITHWKSWKTHWKNILGVKIRINISPYALGIQSSAYRWSTFIQVLPDLWHLKEFWLMDIWCLHVSVNVLVYFALWYYTNTFFEYNTNRSIAIAHHIGHKGIKKKCITCSKTIISIAKKNYRGRGWKYHRNFENQHWVKKSVRKYPLDSKIIWSSVNLPITILLVMMQSLDEQNI